MATTWMKTIHVNQGKSIAATLEERIGYALDNEKTNGSEYIASHGCDPFTAHTEFLFSKRQYVQNTGRNQGKNDVLAYHIRQSFKPGELTPEEALRIGENLAMRFTKGRHQYVVAAHTNTNNPHVHIIFNAVNMDCNRKFKNFKFSAIALRRLSDQICLENGLSVIENPALSKGWNRAEYMSLDKPPTVRDKLRELIDNNLYQGTFEDFIAAMITAGCEVKQGKNLAFKIPDSKKFIRCNPLGDNYTDTAIMERLSGKRTVSATPKTPKETEPIYSEKTPDIVTEHKPNLLIDIQKKLQEGKGGGYAHWAFGFNIQQMSKTLLFLKENGIENYEDLVEKSAAVSAEFNDKLTKIKGIETRLKEISTLQKHIGVYGKTKDIYAKYKASGWDKGFYEFHRADIVLHKEAKQYFDGLGVKKLPTISELKQEYATLLAEKKKLNADYHELKEKRSALITAKSNASRILGITKDGQNHSCANEPKRNNPHER